MGQKPEFRETTRSEILKRHSLRNTDHREAILEVFLHGDSALSHADIEQRLNGGFDRVTLYRTLRTFLDKGILHKVLDDEGTPKYALCKEQCGSAGHHHEHVHFKCTQCGQTHCLEDVQIPAVQLPRGYQPLDVNLLVQGVCQLCSRQPENPEAP